MAMTVPVGEVSGGSIKLLQTTGAGFDGVDLAAVPAGCPVCNVFEHEGAIAEYLILAMLEWQIGIRRLDADLRRGHWTGWTHPHGRLEGRRVGFIGYGHIARETAKRLVPFGVHISARTRTPEKTDVAVQDMGGMDRLDSLLQLSDFVVVACPLNAATRGLIGARELGLMKAEAVLLNVGRGPIVDEDALYQACRDKRIGGAVIDTWYHYPEDGKDGFPSRLPFQDLDNVIMTPHASAEVEDLVPRRLQFIAENLNRLANGETPLNRVN